MDKFTKMFLSLCTLMVFALALNACQPDAPAPADTPAAAALEESKEPRPEAPSEAPTSAPTETAPPAPTATQEPTAANTPTAAPTATETLLPTPAYGIDSTYLSEIDEMTLVFVPAGEFQMGITDEEFYYLSEEIFSFCPNCKISQYHEAPQHPVYLDAYWIDQTEVTNAMYALCAEAGACEVPQPREGSFTAEILYDKPGFENFPMVNVNWFHAQTYCEWAGRRLPTEAEWEKAARGTDGRTYPWGNEPDCLRANYEDCAINSLTRTGRYPKGASPYGALDMAGNVQEWVADWYHSAYYDVTPYDNPQGPEEGTARVIRDGHWDDWSYFGIRTTSRSKLQPGANYFFNYVGFRCALSDKGLSPEQEANITPVAVVPTATPLPSPTPTKPSWPELESVVISPYCSVDGESPVTIRSDQPVTLKWSWGAKTAEQVQEHIDAAIYYIRFEDQPVNPHRRSKIEHISDGDYYRVSWYADLGMLMPGEYFASRGLEWTQQISDGWNTYGPGGEFETVGDECIIQVEPSPDIRYHPAPECKLDLWEEIALLPDARILTHPDIVQGEPVANPDGTLYNMSIVPWYGPQDEDTADYGFWYGIGDTASPFGGLLGYVWEGDIVECEE